MLVAPLLAVELNERPAPDDLRRCQARRNEQCLARGQVSTGPSTPREERYEQDEDVGTDHAIRPGGLDRQPSGSTGGRPQKRKGIDGTRSENRQEQLVR